jgi:DNA methylase
VSELIPVGAATPEQLLGLVERMALERASVETPQEMALLSRRHDAIADLARRAKVDDLIQFKTAEQALRTYRALGKLLADVVPHQGGRPTENASNLMALLDLTRGAAQSISSRSQNVAWLEEQTFEDHIAGRREKAPRAELTKGGAEALAKRLKRARQERAEMAGVDPPVITQASWDEWLPVVSDCDLLLTDPPYSTDIDDIDAFACAWLPVALAKVRPTGRAYVCIGAYPVELRAYLNVKVPEHLTLANVLVWTYRNTLGPAPAYDYKLNWQAILYYRGIDAAPLECPEMIEQFSVQDVNAPDGRLTERYHAWEKPIQLAERFIRHATRPGDLVLDPFAGTGTFPLAAAKLGRAGAGCEIDPDMLAIAQERGCQLAG